MVQRKSNNTTTTTESNRTTTRSELTPSSKPLSNSESESESEQDSESNSSHSSSDSSSSSDTQPETNHSDHEQTFILHRHLDYGHHHHQQQQQPNNQRNTPSQTGFDLFTTRTWKLDQQQIQHFQQLHDTDLVQIHYPVPIKPEPIKKLSLADILPPQPSVSNPPPTKSRLPKITSSPFAGPSVASLYYSAYSSFAPTYDSTASSQTLDQARLLSHSKQKIDAWSRRSQRYHHVLINPEPTSTENITTFKKKKSNAPGIRGRKRQKTSGSTPSSSPAKEPTVPLSPGQVRQEIDATLAETSKLISNLQERQFDRLRHSQELHHLDPSLSNSSIPPLQHPASHHQPVVPEPSRDEIVEAHQLVQRLSSVIARRPRPARPSDDDHPSDAEESVIPSAESIRRSYQVLTVGAGGSEMSRDRAVYSGLLPPTNPVGIPESTLVTEPSAQLISLLENPQRNPAGGGGGLGTPRVPSSLPLISTPQYPSHTGAASRRDPSLSNARIGSNAPLSNGGDYRPALNGHALHTNISKLQLLQQHQRPLGGSAAQHHHHHHHHPALQAEPSIPVRPASSVHSEQHHQQRHLQHLQVQKLLSSSSSSSSYNNTNNNALSHHLLASTPDINASLPVPPIATPSLKPLPQSLSFLDQNSNNLAHPNHRALASSSNSHPTLL